MCSTVEVNLNNIHTSQFHNKNFIYKYLYMWCDQAKSVWSRSNPVFISLTNCMHHFYSYILQKTPLKLDNWFQRYEQLKFAKNKRKQKTLSALFGSILKSIFPTSDWFSLITSHISIIFALLDIIQTTFHSWVIIATRLYARPMKIYLCAIFSR